MKNKTPDDLDNAVAKKLNMYVCMCVCMCEDARKGEQGGLVCNLTIALVCVF